LFDVEDVSKYVQSGPGPCFVLGDRFRSKESPADILNFTVKILDEAHADDVVAVQFAPTLKAAGVQVHPKMPHRCMKIRSP
jgi:hypothetical protein